MKIENDFVLKNSLMRETGRCYIGIEIGGTKLQVVLGDKNAGILERFRMSVDKARGANGIRSNIEEVLPELIRSHNPSAIGIGFGGPVNYKSGKVAISHQVEGWADFDLKSWITNMSGLPCFVDNDANTAALGEACNGAGLGYEKVFYVTLGSGVGGGMINHGDIYHGIIPGESEIGLMAYDRSGLNIESQCSGWAMDNKVRKYIKKNPESILARLVKDETNMEARFLQKAIKLGDPGADSILEKSTDILAWGLSHVVHLFHPEVIILGGGLSLIGELLSDKVSLHLKKYIAKVFQPGPVIKISTLGEDVVCVGALLLAKKNLNEIIRKKQKNYNNE